MQLKFKRRENDTAGFVTWLKQFKDIDTSNCLLMEIDTASKMFVSKVFTADKFLVKFSQISFEDAGYDLVEILDNNKKKVENLGSRVRCGVFMILSKFVDVAAAFVGTDHEMVVAFDENTENGASQFDAQNVMFTSKSLKIRVKMGNVSEFKVISDDVFFNKIYTMATPISVNATKEVLKNIISISGLLSTDSQDEMTFYTKKDGSVLKMYVRNGGSSLDGGYDYFIGDAEGEAETEKTVYRNKFIMVTKSVSGDIVLKIGGSNDAFDQKVLIETNDSNTKNVISTVQY